MTRICPKCSYLRKETDEAHEWQCPACQVAYNKVGGEAVDANYGRYGAPIIRQDGGFPWFKWLCIAALLGSTVWFMKSSRQAPKAPAAAVASAQPKVILYGTAWCGYCEATREFFDKNGIVYTDLDIEKTTAGYEGHKRLGGQGVPVLVIGDEVMHGYSEQFLHSNLQAWLKKGS
jgi:glutaredoxin